VEEELGRKHQDEMLAVQQHHAHELANRLEMQRRQHGQEIAFHMDRQRQQYALDTAAHLDVQRQRHATEMSSRLEGLRHEMVEQSALEMRKALDARDEEWGQRSRDELAQQREADTLAHTAKVVELVAQLKEADERRRKEKRELAEQFNQQLKDARNMIEEVRKERDAERVTWQSTQTEIEAMSKRLGELGEAEIRCEAACKAKEEVQRELEAVRGQLTEWKRLQGTEASRSNKKLNSKLAKLQKEHSDLSALQKQTAMDARELRVRCGKLEVLKEDSDREIKNADTRYIELEKIHDKVTDALTMARLEITTFRDRLKDAPARSLYDAAQKEVHVLRDLLRISTDDLKRSMGECEALRLAFNETENGAFFKALHDRAVAVMDRAQTESLDLRNQIADLRARLMESPPHRNEQEFNAVRAMLGTANAEIDCLRKELNDVRAAYEKSDHGVQLFNARLEIQKLHGVVAVLITEIKDHKLVEKLLESMITQGLPGAAQVAQIAQSANKRAKKMVGNKA